MTKLDGVIWSGFWVISKITPANLCKPVRDSLNYSTLICPFESGKCGKEEEKIQKFEYLENEKSFLDEIKIFLKGYHLVKNKILIKIADTSFKG